MQLADGQAFDRTEQNSMQIVASTKPFRFQADLQTRKTWLNCTSLERGFIEVPLQKHPSITKGNKGVWKDDGASTLPFKEKNQKSTAVYYKRLLRKQHYPSLQKRDDRKTLKWILGK
jgi:hypothetical protein